MKKFEEIFNETAVEFGLVTHWQPLPPLPAEQETKKQKERYAANAEWKDIDVNNLPPERQITDWYGPEYGIITGSIIGGHNDSLWVLPADGISPEIALEEFTRVKMKKSNTLN